MEKNRQDQETFFGGLWVKEWMRSPASHTLKIQRECGHSPHLNMVSAVVH